MIDTAAIQSRFEAIAPFLGERERRLWAASEAYAAGRGGILAVSAVTGIARSTIGRGLAELGLGLGLARFCGHPETFARGVPDAQKPPALFT